MQMSYSLYIHIPFCEHRCAYCDFNTYAGLNSLIPDYCDAIRRELQIIGSNKQRLKVHTVYFGGGTPSLLPIPEYEAILAQIRELFLLSSACEISIEANPNCLSEKYLQELRTMGVNRISIGLQSASSNELRFLERRHSVEQVYRTVSWARSARFCNINLDLIFGLPGQTMKSWRQSLEFALGMEPEHISLYALTIEKGTPLFDWYQRGLIDNPNPDLEADMYEWASEKLVEAGFHQYEISNWEKPAVDGSSRRCVHNLQYWLYEPYLGIGAGAHGNAMGWRAVNYRHPTNYIRALKSELKSSILLETAFEMPFSPAQRVREKIDQSTQMNEMMMMGLRLTQDGVCSSRFNDRFGVSLEDKYGKVIEKLIGLGLLEWVDEPNPALRLTRRGTLLGNQVFLEFV